MKTIPIVGTDLQAIVDDDDVTLVSPYRWRAMRKRSGVVYAVSSVAGGPRRQITIRMHRLITGAKPGDEVDHKNWNGLDNRRENLRICNAGGNQMNRPKFRSPLTSRYKGVHLREDGNRWRAAIRLNGKLHNIGSFVSEEVAAAAYNMYARELFGEYAVLNDVPVPLEAEARRQIDNPKPKKDGTTSQYRGVTWNKSEKKWLARIRVKGQLYRLGVSDSEVEAARMYNEGAVRHLGDMAKLNRI